MDDQSLVRELHRLAHAQEQGQTPVHGQLLAVAVPVDGLALDQFHDQVRQALRGGATVEQPRNVRMIEVRQYLAFGAEPLEHVACVVAGPDELDRDFLLVLRIGAACPVHLPHATAPEQGRDDVGPDAPADPALLGLCKGFGRGVVGGHAIEHCVGLRMRREQRCHFAPQIRILSLEPLEPRLTVVRVPLGGLEELVFDLLPAIGAALHM